MQKNKRTSLVVLHFIFYLKNENTHEGKFKMKTMPPLDSFLFSGVHHSEKEEEKTRW